MANQIGNLNVVLSANSASFRKGFTDAQKQAATSSTAISRSVAGIKSSIGGMAAGLGVGVAAAGVALGAAAKSAFDYASSLGEVARQTGTTVEQYQILARAALAGGIEQGKMDASLKKLNVTLGAAKGGSEKAIAAFKQLGISEAQLQSFNRGGDAIGMVMEGYKRLGAGAEAVKAGTDVMGKGFSDLTTIMGDGADGYRIMGEEARAAGMLTQEQADRADEAADSIGLLAFSLKTKLAIAIADNLPLIESMISGIGRMIDAIADGLRKLQGFVLNIDIARNKIETGAKAYAAWARGDEAGRQAAVAEGQARNARLTGQREENENGDGRRALGKKWTPGIFNMGGGKATSGGGDLDLDLSPKGGGGKKAGGGKKTRSGPSPEQLAREAERKAQDALRDAHRFDADYRRGHMDIIRAQRDLVNTHSERVAIDRELLNYEEDQELIALENAVIMKEMTRERADALKLQVRQKKIYENQLLDLEASQETIRQAAETEDLRLNIQRSALEGEAALATTQAERRAIEQKILDLAYQEERMRHQRVLDDARASPDDKARAQLSIDALGGRKAQDEAAMRNGTMGPLEAWRKSIPKTAAEMNEALQNIQVQGLTSLTDGLTDAAMGMRSLGSVFKQVSREIISSLIRIGIQKALVAAIGESAFGGQATGGGGGFSVGKGIEMFKAIGGVFGKGPKMGALGGGKAAPGLARGGTIKGFGGTDRNLMSINGIPVAKVGRNEMVRVEPNNDNSRGGGIAQIVPSPYFNVVVDNRAQGVATPMISAAGPVIMQQTQQTMARRQARRIP